MTPPGQEATVHEFLCSIGSGLAGRMRVVDYEALLGSSEFAAGTYVLSGIDQLDVGGRSRLTAACDQLAAAPQIRLLNSPRETLLRSDLLAALHRAGLNHHRAVRATDSLHDLAYPVFIREEHGHEGNLCPLLGKPKAVDQHLGVLMARGHRLRDLRVIEFLDTSDRDGNFRTYGAFIVGTEIIPQFLSYGRHWMLKQAKTEFSPAMVLEERQYVLENPHRDALRRIIEVAKVGYGRLDYSLLNGAIETWEINLHPTIGSVSDEGPAELRDLREPAGRHFAQEFQRAFEAVDLPVEAASVILRLAPASKPGIRSLPGRVERDAQWPALKRMLRPIKPMAFHLIKLVSPLLMWFARRFR